MNDHYIPVLVFFLTTDCINPVEHCWDVFCCLKLLCQSAAFHFASGCSCWGVLVRLIVVWGLLQVHVVLKLWKTGFSLDSGELRSYQDPSNAQFLDDIRRGYVARGEWKKSYFLKRRCLWYPGSWIYDTLYLRAKFSIWKLWEGRLEDLL